VNSWGLGVGLYESKIVKFGSALFNISDLGLLSEFECELNAKLTSAQNRRLAGDYDDYDIL